MRRPRPAPISGDQLVTLVRQLRERGQYIRRLECAGRAEYHVLDIASLPRSRPVQTEFPLKCEISNGKCPSAQAAWWFAQMRRAAA